MTVGAPTVSIVPVTATPKGVGGLEWNDRGSYQGYCRCQFGKFFHVFSSCIWLEFFAISV
jgi:hypothetical protein